MPYNLKLKRKILFIQSPTRARHTYARALAKDRYICILIYVVALIKLLITNEAMA